MLSPALRKTSLISSIPGSKPVKDQCQFLKKNCWAWSKKKMKNWLWPILCRRLKVSFNFAGWFQWQWTEVMQCFGDSRKSWRARGGGGKWAGEHGNWQSSKAGATPRVKVWNDTSALCLKKITRLLGPAGVLRKRTPTADVWTIQINKQTKKKKPTQKGRREGDEVQGDKTKTTLWSDVSRVRRELPVCPRMQSHDTPSLSTAVW